MSDSTDGRTTPELHAQLELVVYKALFGDLPLNVQMYLDDDEETNETRVKNGCVVELPLLRCARLVQDILEIKNAGVYPCCPVCGEPADECIDDEDGAP